MFVSTGILCMSVLIDSVVFLSLGFISPSLSPLEFSSFQSVIAFYVMSVTGLVSFFMPLSLWLSCISLECGIFSLTTIFACAFLILCAFRLRNDCFILFFGSYSHNISENLCFHSVSALSAHCLRPRTWTFCHNSFVFSFILIWTPTLAERIAVCYFFFDFCQRFRWKFQQLCCWSCFLYVLDFLSCNKANCTYVQISYFLLPYI